MQRLLLLTASLLPLVACGGSGDAASLKDEAYKAMDGGDSAAALSKFDQLLATLPADAADRVEVSVARCEALAGVDGDRAREEFLKLAGEHDLSVRDYTAVAGKLQVAKAYEPAVLVLDAGMKAFPDDKAKIEPLIAELTKKAQAAGDEGAMSALQGLGYLGGDN